MAYSDSMGNFESGGSAKQADLERIVRRALRANSGGSGLARRVLREAQGLAAQGMQHDSPEVVREIAYRLSSELSAASAARSPRFAPTAPGGTISLGGTVLVA